MKTRVKVLAGVLILAAAGGYWAVKFRPVPVAAVKAGKHGPLLAGAEWGMSPDQVRRNSRLALRPPSPDPIFGILRPSDPGKSVEILETGPVEYAGMQAVERLVFGDGKLEAYYLFFVSRDPESLDAGLRAALIRDFGDRPIEQDPGQALKAIWAASDVNVNYWLVPDEYRLVPTWRAAVGVRKNESA